MTAKRLVFCALLSLLVSCTGDEPDTYSITINADLMASDGELAFMSPAASVIRAPVTDVIGKPYFLALFNGGFSPGNDPSIYETWGEMGEDLSIHFTTPAMFEPGPYDAPVLIYTHTEITQEIKDGDSRMLPAAVGGDLATFSLDTSVVLPGDPSFPPGLVRVNLLDADAEISVANRIPADLEDRGQIAAAMANTILIVP